MTPADIQARAHAGVPLAAAMGIEVLEAASGRALLRLPPSPLVMRPGGTLSGPAIMGLCDVAIWAAFLSLTGGADDARTQNLAVTFLRPTGTAALLAEARVVRQGRRVVYAEVWLTPEGAEAPSGHCTSTWMVVA
ncbi:PaaI family thioesterase [Humitalea sp. 24SJ18S-53]|uniref:PaaI family thioesterase n=1 Tax=Humitalea sp. 24SJ18S-53 TaxID=3422307 RepID=UPI003D677A53